MLRTLQITLIALSQLAALVFVSRDLGEKALVCFVALVIAAWLQAGYYWGRRDAGLDAPGPTENRLRAHGFHASRCRPPAIVVDGLEFDPQRTRAA